MPKLSRMDKFCKSLTQFLEDIQADYNFSLACQVYTRQISQEELNDPQWAWTQKGADPQLPHSDSYQYAESNRCQSFLLCQTRQDRHILLAEELATSKVDPESWYRSQIGVIPAITVSSQVKEAKIWQNFIKNAYLLVKAFLRTDQGPNLKVAPLPEDLLFGPKKTDTLGCYMQKLTGLLKERKLSNYDARIVRRLHNWLQIPLFDQTGFFPLHKQPFLLSYKMSLNRVEKWADLKGRNKARTSSYPIEQGRAVKIIQRLIEWVFHENTWEAVATLLYVWVALSAAEEGKRVTVKEILGISLKKISNCPGAKCPRMTRVIKINKVAFPIHSTLLRFLTLSGDKRTLSTPIFGVNRSTLENYLNRVNIELGYSLDDPITPETFLRRPSLHRVLPRNTQSVPPSKTHC